MADILNRILLRLLTVASPLIKDEPYLKMKWRLLMGRPLDLKNPRTMNEKLQWLKLNNRYPEMTDMVDKIKVKDFVAKKIGSEYVIPTLKVWSAPSDITKEELDSLSEKFVVKTNHGGGGSGVIIVRDKNKVNISDIQSGMAKSLSQDLYYYQREWPYKNIDKQIFAEAYLADDIVDYKFYCFNGEVDAVLLCIDRQSEGPTKFYFFDKEWKLCRYNKAGKAAPAGFTLPKPKNIDKMFEIASELSKGLPFVRVDLYNIDGKIYFGELTFYPDAGFDRNRLPEMDLYFGEKIDLSLARNEID